MPVSRQTPELITLSAEASVCRLCEDSLPHDPRPVFQVHAQARILVAGQAPGRAVHETGIPFDDPSGERLREWMGVDRSTFYDPSAIAILPIGFCYPGRGRSGDLPPRPQCAATWRASFLDAMPDIRLTLVIGAYAQSWHLPQARGTLTDIVANWRQYPHSVLPMPHPSPRNNIWLKRNPWFSKDVLPELQQRVELALN